MSLKSMRIEANGLACPECSKMDGFADNAQSTDLTFCCVACGFQVDACDLLPSLDTGAPRMPPMGPDRDDFGDRLT